MSPARKWARARAVRNTSAEAAVRIATKLRMIIMRVAGRTVLGPDPRQHESCPHPFRGAHQQSRLQDARRPKPRHCQKADQDHGEEHEHRSAVT